MDDEIRAEAHRVAEALRAAGDTVAVAESSAGGRISAALVARPGASASYAGGIVIYTREGVERLLGDTARPESGTQSASEPFAAFLARGVATKLDARWGVGETGASGPTGNPYGDPAGHAWVAVADRRRDRVATRRVRTDDDDREANMQRFTLAALELLAEQLEA